MNPAYFGLVGPEEHTIIALLYLMLKGNTNSRAMMGRGALSGAYTGTTAGIGIQNTDKGALNMVNLFGLENWWGGGRELMERVAINGDRLMTINLLDGNTINVQCPVVPTPGDTTPMIEKMQIGDLYMAPKKYLWSSDKKYFCDAYDMRNYNGNNVVRSVDGIFSLGGVWGNAAYPTRICYRGDVTEYTNPQTFLNLTAVDPAN
jgi:hypothetical protein